MAAVFVTGGTFGLGRETCLGLAEAGHQIITIGVDAAQVASTAEGSVSLFRTEVAEKDLDIEVIEADVTDSNAVKSVVSKTIARIGRIDALVNNAAIGPLGSVLDTDEELFDQVISVNLKGPFITSREVLPHMIAAGGGSIINVGSGAGWGKPNMAAYSASKGGLSSLTTAIAYDFFHKRIRANLVIPGGGGIAGGITSGRKSSEPSSYKSSAVGAVSGRPVQGYDLAGVINFLIGPAGESISGSVIDVGCFANQGGPLLQKGA